MAISPLQNVLGSLGGSAILNPKLSEQEKDFQQFGKDVCSRVVTLEIQPQSPGREFRNILYFKRRHNTFYAVYFRFVTCL